ncbi:uncharacterized protein LOC110111275 [Dendrobium catenatum]|uniref:uncharacterized protein LOC110111275 n=1 Tax=Dendrobium catenatum TaxID=906689 RepID=UPI0009F68D21|nr:uncharacterized protein LOC110111275 [Dendrobium catenatum]
MEGRNPATSDDQNVIPWNGIASSTSDKAYLDKVLRNINSTLEIREPIMEKVGVVSPMVGKGKQVMIEEEKSPHHNEGSTSLVRKLIVRRFANVKHIPGMEVDHLPEKAQVFGRRILVHLVTAELRRQWTKFVKFNLASLGSDWVLCSFVSKEAMDNVLSRGPWFVNGHIVGLDKWSSEFNPNFLKGISCPIWIRIPSLPLYCWDEINVSRIASSVGECILIDGDMF